MSLSKLYGNCMERPVSFRFTDILFRMKQNKMRQVTRVVE